MSPGPRFGKAFSVVWCHCGLRVQNSTFICQSHLEASRTDTGILRENILLILINALPASRVERLRVWDALTPALALRGRWPGWVVQPLSFFSCQKGSGGTHLPELSWLFSKLTCEKLGTVPGRWASAPWTLTHGARSPECGFWNQTSEAVLPPPGSATVVGLIVSPPQKIRLPWWLRQ